MAQKPWKIKVFRGFLMTKTADTVCHDLKGFGMYLNIWKLYIIQLGYIAIVDTYLQMHMKIGIEKS